jgi:hypothetical protein
LSGGRIFGPWGQGRLPAVINSLLITTSSLSEGEKQTLVSQQSSLHLSNIIPLHHEILAISSPLFFLIIVRSLTSLR